MVTLVRELGYSKAFCTLLGNRGLDRIASIRQFLDPAEVLYHDPEILSPFTVVDCPSITDSYANAICLPNASKWKNMRAFLFASRRCFRPIQTLLFHDGSLVSYKQRTGVFELRFFVLYSTITY